MLKKFLALSVASIAMYTSMHAFEFMVEGKGAYFLPQNQKFRKVYSRGGMYGFELTCKGEQNIGAWLSVDWYSKKGTSLGSHYHTRLTMVPIGLGLKYMYSLLHCPIDLYFGAGITGTDISIHDNYPYAISNISKWQVGGIAKVGMLLNYDHFFLDSFINYSYCSIDFHTNYHGKVSRNSMNFGGWAFGIGIGYRFG